MKSVDRRRQTRQLAELTRHDVIAGYLVRHVAEFGARIAGWVLPVENHIPPLGFESFDPTRIGR
jgi:hypothetical protein